MKKVWWIVIVMLFLFLVLSFFLSRIDYFPSSSINTREEHIYFCSTLSAQDCPEEICEFGCIGGDVGEGCVGGCIELPCQEIDASFCPAYCDNSGEQYTCRTIG